MNQITLYTTPTGKIKVLLQDENIWMDQEQIAELFEKTVQNISLHIRNLYDEGELSKQNTIRRIDNSSNTGIGSNKPTQYYISISS